MYRLIFLSGAQKGRRVIIRQGPVILGCHPDSAIRLTDEGVALQHAMLEERPGGGVSIRCLTTDARLVVNRQAVAEAELQDGDQFELGPVKLQFEGRAKPGAPVRMRWGGLQSITLTAVVLMLLGQLAFLVWISAWQYSRNGVVASLAPEQEPAPPSPPAAALAPPPSRPAAPAAIPAGSPQGGNRSGEVAAVSREIKLMQEEVGQLRQQVASLPKPAPIATNPPAASTSAPGPSAAEPENPVWEQAQRMLQRALAQEAALGPEALNQELEKIQRMAPDFMPPYLERARNFEQRKMPREALAQWREVQRRTAAAELLARAKAEVERLAAMDQPPAPAQATEAPALSKLLPPSQPAASAQAPLVRIAAVDQQRFMTNDQFDEMRMLRITVAPRTGVPAADPAGVKALVTFYDQDRDTGRVAPTRAVAPGTALRLADTASLASQPALTAAYLLPRGFREKETRQHNSRRRFYGYRVQVYYQGALQDQQARPLDLLAPDLNP